MRRGKVFVRKLRKGNVVKVVKEHYLRDDIWCGHPGCKECKHEKGQAKLSPTSKQFLIVDTNVVLHELDVLESKLGEEVFDNVIFLQTVLEEVKHRNPKSYSRIRATINSRPHCYVFSNEHHRSTYIERLGKESPNDRNDRAIRVATRWYTEHLRELDLSFFLLTNDVENRQKAVAEGLPSKTLHDFVQELVKTGGAQQDLLELLAAVHAEGDAYTKIDKDHPFPIHLTGGELKKALDSGTAKKGVFNIKRDYFSEAQVKIRSLDTTYFIPAGLEYSNRAVDGDVVAVQLLPKSEWRSPSNRISASKSNAAHDKENSEKGDRDDAVPTARVVGIVERRWRPYCGSFEESEKESGRIFFLSVNRKIPKVKVESRQIQKLMDKRILVQIDSWPRTSRYPMGHYVKTLGLIGDRDTETDVLLIEHDIPTGAWTKSVLKCLPPEDYKISDEERKGRVDLRDECILSIDPPGCTDIDDALHCKPLPNGNLQVGVHIADVTHYMKPETALDEVAAKRCTSVYLVNKRIDMIPGRLSGDLCSLHEHVERLAFSCVWEMTPEAEIVDTKFHKSVISSKGAYTYGQAQEKVDANDQSIEGRSIIGLNKLAKILKQKRLDAGALTLASAEVKFLLDENRDKPLDVGMYKTKEVNSLVEEFMLLANVSVAKKILEVFPNYAMLRRHPVPAPANFEPLIVAAKCVGFDIHIETSKALAESLDNAVVPGNPTMNKLLRMQATRCMSQAVYFSSGEHVPEEFAHYGLASPVYTHFTSPIRRYADVIVHRLLANALHIDPLPTSIQDKSHMKETVETINTRHRSAQMAGRASTELYTLIFFNDKRVISRGIVTQVKADGIRVFCDRYGVEGNIRLWRDPSGDENSTDPKINPWVLRPEDLSLTGPNNTVYRIFEEVQVEIYVQQGKNRRRWMMVELVKGEDGVAVGSVKGGNSNSSSNIGKNKTPASSSQTSKTAKRRKV